MERIIHKAKYNYSGLRIYACNNSVSTNSKKVSLLWRNVTCKKCLLIKPRKIL